MLMFKQINDIDYFLKKKSKKKIADKLVKNVVNNDYVIKYYLKIADSELLFDDFMLEEDDSFLNKIRLLARQAREEEIDFVSH